MKKIIVPIDFSEHSDFALETAANIAKKGNSEILALHMLEISEAVLTHSDSDQKAKAFFLIEMAKKRFETFLDKDYLEGVLVTPIVKHFKVFSEVNDVALEHDADMIIMGSHGASGLKEFFIGSNAEKVVRHSDIPVMIVKHSPILMNFENVVFASDFSDASVAPYKEAQKLFNNLNTSMQLVYVNTPNSKFRSTPEMEKRVAGFLKAAEGDLAKLKDVNYVSDYTVEKGILNFANATGADLIAVSTHGRTGLSHFFEGSISEDITNHSTLPVMTFKI